MLKSEIKQFTIEGEKAHNILDEILSNEQDSLYPLHSTPEDGCYGFYKDTLKSGKQVWVAYDNYTSNCWVNEFNTRKEALDWILGND